jgi:hypothetical protein
VLRLGVLQLPQEEGRRRGAQLERRGLLLLQRRVQGARQGDVVAPPIPRWFQVLLVMCSVVAVPKVAFGWRI